MFYTLGWPVIKAVAEGLPDKSSTLHDYFTTHRNTSVFAPCTDDARALLTWPGFLDWSQPIFFKILSEDMADLVEGLSQSCSDGKAVLDRHPLYIMMVKHGELKSPPPPEGVTVRSLESEEDIHWAVNTWKFTDDGANNYAR